VPTWARLRPRNTIATISMTITSVIKILSLLISLRPLGQRHRQIFGGRRGWLRPARYGWLSSTLPQRHSSSRAATARNQFKTPGGPPRKPAVAKRLMGTKLC
jgi:hypothetical protein